MALIQRRLGALLVVVSLVIDELVSNRELALDAILDRVNQAHLETVRASSICNPKLFISKAYRF